MGTQRYPGGGVSAGTNLYPFDPTALINGVGYVWHCHIVDHEDNEMMRSFTVGMARQFIPGVNQAPVAVDDA